MYTHVHVLAQVGAYQAVGYWASLVVLWTHHTDGNGVPLFGVRSFYYGILGFGDTCVGRLTCRIHRIRNQILLLSNDHLFIFGLFRGRDRFYCLNLQLWR